MKGNRIKDSRVFSLDQIGTRKRVKKRWEERGLGSALCNEDSL